MEKKAPHEFQSISAYHQFRGLPAPEHPLISVINFDDIQLRTDEPDRMVSSYFTIALKRHPGARLTYGQQEYDFNEGVMLFMAPGQVFGIRGSINERPKGWLLMVHPDFLWNTHLASGIKHYEYFDYSANEALFLSQKEEGSIIEILKGIAQEYHANMDHFSHSIIIAQLDLLLSYSQRYYNRQFLTRRITNHKMVERLEKLLNTYFSDDTYQLEGIPTVEQVAGWLYVSPKYLSGLLKGITGQSTQQHIHNKLIDKAKEKLSTSTLSVSEIAYELGFEHPQSFSKFFKSKTDQSPTTFRSSFN